MPKKKFMAAASSPGEEYRAKLFETFFSLRSFLGDRRAIMRDPKSLRRSGTCLSMKPFQFAIAGLLLPTIIIGFLMTVIVFFAPLPTSSLEREIKFQEELVESFEAFRAKVSKSESDIVKLDQLSDDELEQRITSLSAQIAAIPKDDPSPARRVERGKLSDRELIYLNATYSRLTSDLEKIAKSGKQIAAEGRLRSLRLKNMLSFLNSWKEIIVGGILIANAYVFELLCRRIEPPPKFLGSTGSAYLFAIGSALFYPSIFATLSLTILGLADRYEIDWLSTTSLASLGLIILWARLCLGSAEKWIDLAIDDRNSERPGRVGNRFAVSVLVTTVTAILLIEGLIFGMVLWGPAALATP